MTVKEYNLRMEAENLKQFDLDYRAHLQAYLNMAVQRKKKSGKVYKAYYSTFDKFFHYEREMERRLGRDGHAEKLKDIARIMKGGDHA